MDDIDERLKDGLGMTSEEIEKLSKKIKEIKLSIESVLLDAEKNLDKLLQSFFQSLYKLETQESNIFVSAVILVLGEFFAHKVMLIESAYSLAATDPLKVYDRLSNETIEIWSNLISRRQSFFRDNLISELEEMGRRVE